MCDCNPQSRALYLAQRKSGGRVPGYTPSAYNRSYSSASTFHYREREALYPTQFDYEYNYTEPYDSFPYTYNTTVQPNSLFMPQWL